MKGGDFFFLLSQGELLVNNKGETCDMNPDLTFRPA